MLLCIEYFQHDLGLFIGVSGYWMIAFLNAKNFRLGRLQDSNAVLSHFNEFSENCFADISGDITRNTRLLKSMKSDLDYIFLKLRYFNFQLLFLLWLCACIDKCCRALWWVLKPLSSTCYVLFDEFIINLQEIFALNLSSLAIQI